MSLVTVLAAVSALAVAAAAGWRLRRLFLVVTIAGPSMLPALAPGDRVLVRRARLDKVRAGVIVAVRLPPPSVRRDRAGGWLDAAPELMVKRAVALPGDPAPAGLPVPAGPVPARHLVVLGDNSRRSHDSRAVGYVPGEALVGVVVRRLTPGSS